MLAAVKQSERAVFLGKLISQAPNEDFACHELCVWGVVNVYPRGTRLVLPKSDTKKGPSFGKSSDAIDLITPQVAASWA